MKPLKRVQRVIILVVMLLLVGGLSVAQEPNFKDWGSVANGLQMRISLDQAAARQSETPKFRVELRNVGEKDLFLNLGVVTPQRGQQYPTAISLILLDPLRPFQLIELKRSVPVRDEGKETLYLPLPVGATFSFRADLDEYWAMNSTDFESKLKAGTYWLAAHLNGFLRTDSFQYPLYPFTLSSGPVLVRRAATLQTFCPPPRSNVLRFEIPSR